MITLSSYDLKWLQIFDQEKQILTTIIGDNCSMIHHIGSTSVVGLIAKPVIDIMSVVYNSEKIDDAAMLKANFTAKGEYNIPLRRYYSKKGELKIHLHIFELDNDEINLHLTFRDYLRVNPVARLQYNTLKVNLLKSPQAHEINAMGFTNYTTGKDAFIKQILNKAGFNGLTLKFPHLDCEWAKVRELQISDQIHPDTKYILLYQGTSIIGLGLININHDIQIIIEANYYTNSSHK